MKARTPLALSALTLAVSLANAETVADTTHAQIEEVVVTATFAQSDLMQTPASISVLDAQQLQARGAQHLENVLNVAPNVTYSSGASRSRFVQIRGVGDLEQFSEPKYQASVGLTIDDIDMSGLAGGATLIDTQQIEILRGPQGTRFGNSGLAGMVNIIGNEPTEEFEAEISAEVGNYGKRSLGVMASGALGDNVNGRIALQQQQADGYIENATLGFDDTNNIDELTGKAKLQWTVSDSSTVDLTLLRIDQDNGYDAYSYNNDRVSRADEPGTDRQKTWAAALKKTDSFDNGYRLETIATAQNTKLNTSFDADWDDGLNQGWSGTENYWRERDALSLEARLHADRQFTKQGDSDWTVGAYVKRRDESLDSLNYGFAFSSDYEDSSQAIYGEYRMALQDKIHLTGGLRFERFGYDYKDDAQDALSVDENLWGGNLTLEYLATDNTLLYAQIARGYKAGGVNATAKAKLADPSFTGPKADFIDARQTFESETLVNTELGIKSTYFDNRLSLRAALFHMQRSNPQLENWVVADDFSWVNVLDTAGKGTNQGIELEIGFQATETLHLTANLGLLKTEVENFSVYDIDQDTEVDLSGRDQARAPDFQYSLAADWLINAQLRANLTVEGSDESYTAYYHNSKLEGYKLLHASLTFNHKRVEISAWARNLTNEEYANHGIYFGGGAQYNQLSEPRTFGINGTYAF